MMDFQLVLEPVSVSDPEWGRVYDVISKNYPNSCVVRIEKVLSKNSDEYSKRLRDLDIEDKEVNDRPENFPIKEMFHGTKEKHVANILREGLKKSKNRVSAFGKGTYFSPNIRTSLFGYTDISKSTKLSYVFLCDIILSETGGNKRDIYVCPRDDSFVIKYLIRFYKNAP